jgi:hypothetical protein
MEGVGELIISIHQPDYIPYIGYFYKIAQSEIFVFLDDVQFSNDNMHNWNKIKTPQGECRLKIPVKYKFGDKISQVNIRDELKWKSKHLKTIEMNYSRTMYFKEIFPEFKEIILKEYNNFSELNIMINKWICSNFGFETKFYCSSEMNIKTAKEERVLDICEAVGADIYLSGNGARVYQREEHFCNRGITLQYTDYNPIVYNQLWNEFIPNLSILDYIFNYGFDWEYIKKSIGGI